MATKQFIQAKFKKQGDNISVIVSDETLDRHGDVIKLGTWDLRHFSKSPRMLVDHDHQVEKIVGKWENPRVDGGGLVMDAVFHDITPLARATKEMVEGGFLDTVSVGFIPHGPEKDGDSDRNELIEVSWVTVPANPNARILKELMDKNASQQEVNAVKKFVGDEEETVYEEEIEPDVPELKAINSLEEYQTFKEEFVDDPEKSFVKVSIKFLDSLISEKQPQALGGSGEPEKQVVVSKKDEVLHQALKEAARVISQGLYKYNRKN